MITNIITQVAGQQQPVAVTTIIKCEGPKCENVISFDNTTKEQVLKENLWLKTYRTVQTGDGRSFGYCSDACEVNAVATGSHNIPEAPKIIQPNSPTAVAAAAQAAAAAAQADKSIRAGQPAKVQLTD